MRNVWLVIRREYLERVRAKSFLISTILMPAFVFAVTVLPSKLASMKTSGDLHLVVVASNPAVADAVDHQLHSPRVERKYEVEKRITDDPAAKAALDADVTNRKIDAYLWLTDQAIADNKATYSALTTSDFIVDDNIRNAAADGVTRARLLERGVGTAEVEAILKPVHVDMVALAGGKKKGGELAQFFAAFLVAMMLYINLIMYGMAVMRSVLEEKSTHVMEVLLASLTSKQLMAGKLFGVGAVGLTQMSIWTAFILVLGSPTMASPEVRELFSTQPLLIVFLPVFFVLGFMLYSGMYAALGAAVNSEQEAQQWQWFVTMPLIIPIILVTRVIIQPDGPMATWLSMVPFFSPILMYVRIVAHTPPAWQIALSVVLLLVTTYALLVVSSRIYRVGVLMYGKRPTLPEILKWLKYA